MFKKIIKFLKTPVGQIFNKRKASSSNTKTSKVIKTFFHQMFSRKGLILTSTNLVILLVIGASIYFIAKNNFQASVQYSNILATAITAEVTIVDEPSVSVELTQSAVDKINYARTNNKLFWLGFRAKDETSSKYGFDDYSLTINGSTVVLPGFNSDTHPIGSSCDEGIWIKDSATSTYESIFAGMTGSDTDNSYHNIRFGYDPNGWQTWKQGVPNRPATFRSYIPFDVDNMSNIVDSIQFSFSPLGAGWAEQRGIGNTFEIIVFTEDLDPFMANGYSCASLDAITAAYRAMDNPVPISGPITTNSNINSNSNQNSNANSNQNGNANSNTNATCTDVPIVRTLTGSSFEETTSTSPPTFEQFKADISGSVAWTAGHEPTSVGFKFAPEGGTTTTYDEAFVENDSGTFSKRIYSIKPSSFLDGNGPGYFVYQLIPNERYQFEAFAINDCGSSKPSGFVSGFTTGDGVINITNPPPPPILPDKPDDPQVTVGAPTVKTFAPDINNIKSTSIIPKGNIVATGNANIIRRGFEWRGFDKQMNLGTVAQSTSSSSYSTGDFGSSLSVTGLNPDTTYWIHAFATNYVGTNYGDWISFTTKKDYRIVVNVTGGGSANTDSGSSFYIGEGEDYNVRLTPNANSILLSLKDGTTEKLATIPNRDSFYQYPIDNINSDHTITATYVPSDYAITQTSSSGGKVVLANASVEYDGNTSFTIRPDAGYEIASIKDNGIVVSIPPNPRNASRYNITNVKETHRIEATFAQIMYTLTSKISPEGSPAGVIYISPIVKTVAHGRTAIFDILANDSNWKITMITERVAGVITKTTPPPPNHLFGYTYKIGSVTGDTEVTVDFEGTDDIEKGYYYGAAVFNRITSRLINGFDHVYNLSTDLFDFNSI